MDDREYVRDEKLIQKRRMKRLEEKRRRTIRLRLIYAGVLAVVIVGSIFAFKSCGAKDAKPPVEPVIPPVVVPEKPDEEKVATLSAVGDI